MLTPCNASLQPQTKTNETLYKFIDKVCFTINDCLFISVKFMMQLSLFVSPRCKDCYVTVLHAILYMTERVMPVMSSDAVESQN